MIKKPFDALNGKYCNSLDTYSRFVTREVLIGNIAMGAHNPIRIQSMTTTDTMDTLGTVEQTIRMVDSGCELVRITAPSIKEAKNLALIKSWELRFLIWTICTLWSPLIGFSLPGICLVLLSFLFLMVTLTDSEDLVEFVEDFFLNFITDSRFLGMMLLVLIFIVYILVSEGWSGITSLFSM
jgi:hypothetical protein